MPPSSMSQISPKLTAMPDVLQSGRPQPDASPGGTMRRVRKVLGIALIVVLVVAIVTPLAGWLFLRRSLPQTRGTDRVAGIGDPIQIVRDSYGVPYVYAATDHDAFFAL